MGQNRRMDETGIKDKKKRSGDVRYEEVKRREWGDEKSDEKWEKQVIRKLREEELGERKETKKVELSISDG